MNQVILCNQCKKELTSSFLTCHSCKSNYHFRTCSPLSENTYMTMTNEKKAAWKCHICKPRSKSPNTMYQAVIFDEKNNKKQARTDDEDSENDQAKKFKDKEIMSLTSVNNKLWSLQTEVTEGFSKVEKTIEQLSTNINTSNIQIKDEIQSALSTITTTLTALVDQVKKLNEKDQIRESQISAMDNRINKLEQEMLSKNIEIKNINNQQISAYEVVRAIGMSINVEINERDIDKAYRVKKQNNNIIIEFATLNKKIEFMDKIDRHRIDPKNVKINGENIVDSNTYIYINDHLTYNNRRLLWLAKTKAKEAKWKFVWVRNGTIFARKNENSTLIIINNSTDIEFINNTI